MITFPDPFGDDPAAAKALADALAVALAEYERAAEDLTCALRPGLTSATELMSPAEYAAMDEEFWGKWDAPTIAFTKGEEAAFAEIIRPYVKGGQS
jgi:hypothetical protein